MMRALRGWGRGRGRGRARTAEFRRDGLVCGVRVCVCAELGDEVLDRVRGGGHRPIRISAIAGRSRAGVQRGARDQGDDVRKSRNVLE